MSDSQEKKQQAGQPGGGNIDGKGDGTGASDRSVEGSGNGAGSDKETSGGKSKPGGKGMKAYLLCGFVSTYAISEFLSMGVGGFFGVILWIPLMLVNTALLQSVLGSGGVELLNDYAMFAGIMVGFLLALLIVKPWRPYLKAFGTGPSGNRVGMLLLGLLIGFVTNGICVAGAVLAGNIQLEFTQFSVVGLMVFFIFILIQASTEELVCRGFAYQRLKRTYGTAAAVVGSAIIFSLGHIFNTGVTPLALIDIFLIGVFYALMVRYCDSIWMAMGAHTAWNFTQNILLGLPNSGTASSYSFFGLAGTSTNSLAYDTAFGVEGTVLAVVLNIICIVALYLWGRKHGKKEAYDVWQGSGLDTPQPEDTANASAASAAVEPEAPATAGSATSAPVAKGVPATTAPAPKKRWFY